MNYRHLTLFLFVILVFAACSVDGDVHILDDQNSGETLPTDGDATVEEGVTLAQYSLDSDDNSTLMFQDDESVEEFTSESRRYEIAKMLRIKAVDEFTLEVANFAPVDLHDLVISATIGEKTIALFAIDKIRGHAYRTIKYPFVENIMEFNSLDGTEVIDLSHLKDGGIPKSDIKFNFHGDSELVKALKGLSDIKWKPKMNFFDPNGTNPNWRDTILPVDARRYTALMINWAYMFTTPEFKEAFFDEPILENDGTTLFTQRRKGEIWDNIVNKGKLNLGITSGRAAGLGGGRTFGLYRQIVERFLVSTRNTASTAGHEFGHIVGFKHSSNMTYPKEVNGERKGFSLISNAIMGQFLQEGRFPITIDNYYLRTDYDPDYVNPSGKSILPSTDKGANELFCGEAY